MFEMTRNDMLVYADLTPAATGYPRAMKELSASLQGAHSCFRAHLAQAQLCLEDLLFESIGASQRILIWLQQALKGCIHLHLHANQILSRELLLHDTSMGLAARSACVTVLDNFQIVQHFAKIGERNKSTRPLVSYLICAMMLMKLLPCKERKHWRKRASTERAIVCS